MNKFMTFLAVLWTFLYLASCGDAGKQAGDSTATDQAATDTLVASAVTDTFNLADESFNDAETNAIEQVPVKEIEALALSFKVEKREDGFGKTFKYSDKYLVTLHMNGDVEVHMELPDVQLDVYTEEYSIKTVDTYDFQGNWAQRSQKRGANYVDYFDIEFNNGARNLNWCVDNECKFIYFTWDAFLKRNADLECKIQKVDTIYVGN